MLFPGFIVASTVRACACCLKADDKKRKKKKPKLDMHEQQLFIDGPDVSCSMTLIFTWLLALTVTISCLITPNWH